MTRPTASTGAVSTSSTKVTKWGFPIETAVPWTVISVPSERVKVTGWSTQVSPGQSMGMAATRVSALPISTSASTTLPFSTVIWMVLMPPRVSRVMVSLWVSPLS